MKNLIQKVKQKGKLVLTGTQIVAILTLGGGAIQNYWSNHDNSIQITNSSEWMKNAIKNQSEEIKNLQMENISYKTEIMNLKERVSRDEHLQDTLISENSQKNLE
jgi:predicted RNase H-like nuclease (RuvC/YqgF family)